MRRRWRGGVPGLLAGCPDEPGQHDEDGEQGRGDGPGGAKELDGDGPGGPADMGVHHDDETPQAGVWLRCRAADRPASAGPDRPALPGATLFHSAP